MTLKDIKFHLKDIKHCINQQHPADYDSSPLQLYFISFTLFIYLLKFVIDLTLALFTIYQRSEGQHKPWGHTALCVHTHCNYQRPSDRQFEDSLVIQRLYAFNKLTLKSVLSRGPVQNRGANSVKSLFDVQADQSCTLQPGLWCQLQFAVVCCWTRKQKPSQGKSCK